MSVVYDNVSSGKIDPGTSINFNHTLGSNSSGYVLVAVITHQSQTPTCTINGNAATNLGNSGDPFGRTGRLTLFGLATGATSGSIAIVVSWSTSHSGIAFSISGNGVDQVTPTSGFVVDTADIGDTSISVNVTTIAGDLTVGFVGSATDTDPSAPSQTAKSAAQSTGVTDAFAEWVAIGPGSGTSDTHSWTLPTSGGYLVGVNLKAAAEASGPGLMMQSQICL